MINAEESARAEPEEMEGFDEDEDTGERISPTTKVSGMIRVFDE